MAPRPILKTPISLICCRFSPDPSAPFWQPDCEYKCDLQFRSRKLAMLGELTNIPTDTLIDMLYVILAGEVAISAGDAVEIEQIQRELQRRGGTPKWSFAIVN